MGKGGGNIWRFCLGEILIQDDLGNYYIVSKVNGKKLLLKCYYPSYFPSYFIGWFIQEVRNKYDENVAIGQYFADGHKKRIEGLSSGKYPGGIYKLSDILKEYEVEVDSLYEKSVSLK